MDYMRQLRVQPPRHYDLREWKPYVVMLSDRTPQIYNHIRMLDKDRDGLIFILVGRRAEQLAPLIDKSKHDVRDYEPYFYREDNIRWMIR